MKLLMQRVALIVLVSSVVSTASELQQDFEADDFEQIKVSSNLIIETSEKATRGIDWDFELANKSDEWAYVKLIQNGKLVLSGLDQTDDMFGYRRDYYLLVNDSTVRIAGLDLDIPIQLTVLRINEINELENQAKKFARPPQRIVANVEEHGRVLNKKVEKGNTAYMMIDRDFKLKPQQKTFFKKTTDSGLPLDNNIK